MPDPSHLTHLTLRRDAQGRIIERVLRLGKSVETRRYAYDAAGRLSRVTDERDSLVESYQYDHEGRRLADIRPESQRGERRFSYGPANRLGQAGSAQYGHDRAGFRSLKLVGDAETRYHYEPSGLLLHVDLPGGRRIQYVHDSSGLRIEKRVNGRVVEAYRWLDPLRLSEFHDGSRWWRFAYLEGRTPVGLTDGERSYFLLCDQLGTPLALATPDGHVVQAMQYDSFGNLLEQRGDVVRLPLGFAGGLFDADTGLTRFVWRDYDAATGRFTALDPLRDKGGDTDWYGYCVDDPVNRVDVWGLEGSWWDGAGGRVLKSGKTGASIGGAVGAAIGAPFAVPIPGRIAGSFIGGGIGMGAQAVIEYPPIREQVDAYEEKIDEWRQNVWDSIPPVVQERMERIRSLEDYSTE